MYIVADVTTPLVENVTEKNVVALRSAKASTDVSNDAASLGTVVETLATKLEPFKVYFSCPAVYAANKNTRASPSISLCLALSMNPL